MFFDLNDGYCGRARCTTSLDYISMQVLDVCQITSGIFKVYQDRGHVLYVTSEAGLWKEGQRFLNSVFLASLYVFGRFQIIVLVLCYGESMR